MDVDKQLKSVEDFFNFTLTRIPDFDQKRDLDRPLNAVKIRKDILIRYNKLKSILDEDLWQTFSKRSIYILQALENLVDNVDDDDCDESTDDESSDESINNDGDSGLILKDKSKVFTGKELPESDRIFKSINSAASNTNLSVEESEISIVANKINNVEMSNSDDENDDDLYSNNDSTGDESDDLQISESNIIDESDNFLFNIKEGFHILNNDDKNCKSNIDKRVNIKKNKTSSVTREQLKRKLEKKILEHKVKRLKFDEKRSSIKNKKTKKNKSEKHSKTELTTAPISPKKDDPPAQEKVKFNADKTVIFSKIEFPSENKKKGKLKGLPRGRNYDQLLEMVVKEKQKIKELKMLDMDKAKNYKEKVLWRKIMAKAEGVKIKDNEHMLRKSLNRKEFKKSKGKQKWKERKIMVSKKIQEKQSKRKENINKKKEQRKKKKVPTATLR